MTSLLQSPRVDPDSERWTVAQHLDCALGNALMLERESAEAHLEQADSKMLRHPTLTWADYRLQKAYVRRYISDPLCDSRRRR